MGDKMRDETEIEVTIAKTTVIANQFICLLMYQCINI